MHCKLLQLIIFSWRVTLLACLILMYEIVMYVLKLRFDNGIEPNVTMVVFSFLVVLLVCCSSQQHAQFIYTPDFEVEDVSAIECGNLVNMTVQKSNWIATPDFPNKYPPDTDCSWHVKANFGERIRLVMEHFALQPAIYYKCKSDFLEVVDADQNLKFCGLGISSRQHLTAASQIELRFHSDESWESSGFRIRLEVIRGTCTANIDDVQSGSIASPGYPLPYPPDTVCSWKIKVPENTRVQLDCSEPFLLEGSPTSCRNDFLAVSITGDESFARSRRYCWDKGPSRLTSVENTLTVLFKSNPWYQFRGFRCKFTYAQEKLDYTFPNTSLPLCRCGRTSTLAARIVGGEEVTPHSFPWMAALVAVPKVLLCGGSLISDRYVLTASHCFMTVREQRLLRIILGEHNLQTNEETGTQIIGIERIIQHVNYDHDTTVNDIALVRLSHSVTFTPDISPICLPNAIMNLDRQMMMVAGWGRLANAGIYSDTLQVVNLEVQAQQECQEAYRGIITLTPGMLCAGNGTKDSCQGDSGGPLMMETGGIIYQAGIVSFGLDCGTYGVAGVYVRVDQFLDFIAENTLRSDKCVPLKKDEPLVVDSMRLQTRNESIKAD